MQSNHALAPPSSLKIYLSLTYDPTLSELPHNKKTSWRRKKSILLGH